MLQGENLTLTCQDGESTLNAVQGVSIAIEDRQFIDILGPSGSGKSSLLYLLSGLRKAIQGEVFLDILAYSKNWIVLFKLNSLIYLILSPEIQSL